MEDVMPFLDNVLKGKNVPESRKLEVAHHYEAFGGVSPINAHNRELVQKLTIAFEKNKIDLPIYWGNRNWDPYIKDALIQMKADGKKHALSYFTSAFSSYSGCRQYRENIQNAQAEVGEDAPQVSKLRMFFNHPNFIDVHVQHIQHALTSLDPNKKTFLVFTAHSIPVSMSQNCDYVMQLNESCRLVCEKLQVTNSKLVFQSRSGPHHIPWLEPDVCDFLEDVKTEGFEQVIVSPVGFVSDHMEVMYDLDVEAKQKAKDLGLGFARAKSPGNDDLFVGMIVDLVLERLQDQSSKKALGPLGPWHDVCPPECCKYSQAMPTSKGQL